jgi:EAL domain-containing protein (putative c-di-GMP-specific phosphodiesterase class I)
VIIVDLQHIIEKKEIEHEYQPIWNLNSWQIHGYEVLARFPSNPGENIEKVFQMAGEQGILFELDTLSILEGVKNFSKTILDYSRLFVNIFPSTILDPKFEAFIKYLALEYPHVCGNLVLELNESITEEHLWNISILKSRISMLKRYHILVGLDHIGKGAATLQKVIDLSPDYIKLDRYFAENLSNSKEKQEIISLFIRYCKNNIQVILEGIERDTDLAWARLLNVPIVQGYLLGKPQKIAHSSVLRNFRKNQYSFLKYDTITNTNSVRI